jgi:hypothetical protein
MLVKPGFMIGADIISGLVLIGPILIFFYVLEKEDRAVKAAFRERHPGEPYPGRPLRDRLVRWAAGVALMLISVVLSAYFRPPDSYYN